MITLGDVQRVVDAFILEENLYWWLHPIERVNTVRAIDACDGYHWLVARQLAQDHDWVALKKYMNTMGETYLRETMEHLIQSVSTIIPRLLNGMSGRRGRRRRGSSPPRRPRFRQNGRGIMSVLANAAKIGYKLGRNKRYKRMGAKGATDHYRRHPRPWEG